MDGIVGRAFAGMQAQMAEQSRLVAARYAQETFESALDFLIAHELAHRLFGHALTREAPAASDATLACTEWREQELVADEFASVILVQRQLAESRPAQIVVTGSGWRQEGATKVPSIDGGRLFLATAYRLAGFGQSLAGSDCHYPAIEQRLADVGLLLAVGQGAGESGLHYEGLIAGSRGRAKDNVRLATLVGDEPPSEFSNVERRKIQRVQQLIKPMVEYRFKDRI